MSTQFLVLPEGSIAFDDQGQGPLILCVPAGGDLPLRVSLSHSATRRGRLPGRDDGPAWTGGIQRQLA